MHLGDFVKNTVISGIVGLVLVSVNTLSATVSEKQDSFLSPKRDSMFYYRMGGGRAFTSAPRWEITTIDLSVTAAGKGLGCGNFDPKITVENTLNNVKDGVDNIMGQLEGASNAAIANLPGYILQKIDPGLYDFFMNNILRAERSFSLATKTCEQMQRQIARGNDPYEEMVQASWGDTWKASAGTNGVNILDVQKEASDKAQHDDGVNWFGEKRGGKNQIPLWILQDTAVAGYNKLLGRDLLDESAPVDPESQPLTQMFETPNDLREWVVTVLGDTRIGICNGCEKGTKTGQGLALKADDIKDTIYPKLDDLYQGDSNPTLSNLIEVSAPGVSITAQVIRNLQEMQPVDAQIYLNKILDEITLSIAVNEALFVIRMLRSGQKDPDLIAYDNANKAVISGIDELNEEVDSLIREAKIRKELVSATITEALMKSAAERTAALGVAETQSEPDSPYESHSGSIPE